MSIYLVESAKQNWEGLTHRPFFRLIRHCVDRVFSGNEGSEPGELDVGIGTILALLATPGAFVSLFLSSSYGSLMRYLHGQPTYFDPFRESLADEYFFIVLALVVAGAVAVWKWDRLLPDRRDYANLAPLPITSRRIFLANLVALSLLAVVLSLDLNAASSLFFPVIVCAQEPFRVLVVFFATHALAVTLASVFGFLAVFAVLGILMVLLPYRTFRKSSLYARCAIIIFLMALLTSSFSVPQKMRYLPHDSHSWTKLPPPAWFLGLCETLRGENDSVLTSLSGAAIAGLLYALLLSLVAYALCYTRCFKQSAEIMVSSPSKNAVGISSFVFRLLDKILLKTAFQRACYRFAFRTIFRSEELTFALGGFLSLGFVIASQTILLAINKESLPTMRAIPSVEILSVPLILGYFLIFGLWSVFAIPSLLRANWVFRFHINLRTRECVSLARKIIFTFIGPFLVALCLPVYSHYWGWRVGTLHTTLVAVWCVLLMETLLVGFRKIPFTCSLPKFKSHVIVIALLFVLGFFAFTSVTATVESWALADPLWFIAFTPVVLGVSIALYQWRKSIVGSDQQILFEEKAVTTVEVLNLSS